MTFCRGVGILALGVVTTPSAAWANNAPAPDGVLALVALFPAVLVGSWLAHVPGPAWPRRVLGAFGLLPLVLLAAAGTEIGGVAALGVVLWAGSRAVRIARVGRRPNAIPAAAGVLILTVFAGASYLAAVAAWVGAEADGAYLIVRQLRIMAEDQAKAKTDRVLDVDGNGVGEYVGIESLTGARSHGLALVGHRYDVSLAGVPARDEVEFLIYATPINYGGRAWQLLPGGSLLRGLSGRRPVARFTYGIDETGVVRRGNLGTARAPSRSEFRSWPPVP